MPAHFGAHCGIRFALVNSFIVEADGGSRGNPGPAAFGTVVRDATTTSVIAEIAGHLGIATNNVAEYHGALAGITHVHELNPAGLIEVRLDSKLVVEQMSGRWKIKHPSMRDLALQVRAAHNPELVTYMWVARAENAHADGLVNEMLDAFEATGVDAIMRELR